MRKLVLAAVVALCAAGSAGAIVNGEPDGNRHPYVVALGLTYADGSRSICSGTLVSSTLVVTAGHCTYGAVQAVVWNTPRGFAGLPQSAGIPITHPDFEPEFSSSGNTSDLGVVRLFAPIVLERYGALPAAGYLDDLGPRRGHQLDVTLVGYGVQGLDPFLPPGERMMATARIKNLNANMLRDYGVKISGVNGSGRAGSCLGDSGGPILHESSNVVLAVHSFGDVDTCEGANYAYRLDTPSARAFLAPFLTR